MPYYTLGQQNAKAQRAAAMFRTHWEVVGIGLIEALTRFRAYAPTDTEWLETLRYSLTGGYFRDMHERFDGEQEGSGI